MALPAVKFIVQGGGIPVMAAYHSRKLQRDLPKSSEEICQVTAGHGRTGFHVCLKPLTGLRNSRHMGQIEFDDKQDLAQNCAVDDVASGIGLEYPLAPRSGQFLN